MKKKYETVLELDKKIVYEMGTSLTHHIIMDAFSIEHIFHFGEKAGIINILNYTTIIKRFRKALDSLWLEGKCDRLKDGRGYSYDFTKSLGNEY